MRLMQQRLLSGEGEDIAARGTATCPRFPGPHSAVGGLGLCGCCQRGHMRLARGHSKGGPPTEPPEISAL